MRQAVSLVVGSLVLAAAGFWAPGAGATSDWAPELKSDRLEADRVVVLKRERRLLLMHRDRILRVYRIALGRNPEGHKVRRGDGRTPEGRYVLDWRNSQSRFYRSIHISYPNAADRARAHRLGVRPGGDIMIHGLPARLAHLGPAHARRDWTEGCIAVSNGEIDEIWRAVEDGTAIEIHP